MASSESLRRRPAFRPRFRRFLIIHEGEVTEADYFSALKKKSNGQVALELKREKSPGSAVALAVKLKTENLKQDPELLYDEVWCVFDIDSFDLRQVRDASRLALENDISLAISNPCFELWLLLHFQDQGAEISAKNAQRSFQKLFPQYDKKPPMEGLYPTYKKAVERANQLEAQHARNNKSGANPSTGVHILTERITKQTHP